MLYHWCVRVYNNDDRVIEVRSQHELPEWLEYNKTARFGNALFVDGQCVANGYLSQSRCDAWTEKLTAEFAGINQAQLQRQARPSATGHRLGRAGTAHMALMTAALSRMGAVPVPQPESAEAVPTKKETTRPSTVKTGRNEPCVCGSGNKFKRCCGSR